MGDNFVHQTYYGSAPSFSQTQPVFNGGGRWYWIDGAAVQISSMGRKQNLRILEAHIKTRSPVI